MDSEYKLCLYSNEEKNENDLIKEWPLEKEK